MSDLTKIPTPTACTCESCPEFNDFNEQRGRGLCKVFDQVTYRHHSLTQDCLTSLSSETEDEVYQERPKTVRSL